MEFLADGKEGRSRRDKSISKHMEVGKIKGCSSNFRNLSSPGT